MTEYCTIRRSGASGGSNADCKAHADDVSIVRPRLLSAPKALASGRTVAYNAYRHCPGTNREMWAKTQETRDSISVILYAGCLGLSPVISANIHSLSVRRSVKSRKQWLKIPILGVQGRSRSSMLVPRESSSAVIVIISSKSVSICNRSHA